MAAYLVFLPKGANNSRINDVNAMIAHAADAAAAKALAKAAMPANPALWDNAVAMQIPANYPLLGFTFTVKVGDLSAVSATGDWTNNTVDAIAALLVTALNAKAEISAAAYNSSTNVLTAAGVADELGDQVLTVTVTDLAGNVRADMVGTITDQGADTDALTVAFAADTTTGIFAQFNFEGGIQLSAPAPPVE